MTIFGITGGMLRAARSLTGLTQQELADRASITRPCLTAWEGSSGSIPNAGVRALHRVVSALEAEGVEFQPNSVSLQRTAPIASVIPSEGAAAGQAKCADAIVRGEIANSRDDNPKLKAFRKLGL
jgi:transcriptional regulator with XRE-family HTH domain